MGNPKYFLWIVAFLLALEIGIAREVEIPCANLANCTSLPHAPSNIVCENGFCKCPNSESGILENCVYANGSSHQDNQQAQQTNAGLIGRICSLETDCNVLENVICNRTRKQCECSPQFVPAKDNQRCVRIMQYNETGCEIDQQCLAGTVSNTSCVNGTCLCAENYYYTSNSCWSKIPFGSACNVTAECQHVVEAECEVDQRVCSCPKGTVIDPMVKSCLPLATSTSNICVEDIQCQSFGTGATCSNKRCRCREYYHLDAVSQKCVPNLGLGDACTVDRECWHEEINGQLPAMRCVNQICVCSPGFQIDDNKCRLVDASETPKKDNGRGSATRPGEFGLVFLILALSTLLPLSL